MWKITKTYSFLHKKRNAYYWNATICKFCNFTTKTENVKTDQEGTAVRGGGGEPMNYQMGFLKTSSTVKSIKKPKVHVEQLNKKEQAEEKSTIKKDFMVKHYEAEMDKMRASTSFESLVKDDPVPWTSKMLSQILQGDKDKQRRYWERKRKKQLEIEMKSIYEAIEDYKKDVKSARNREAISSLPKARRLLLNWLPVLKNEIEKEQTKVILN